MKWLEPSSLDSSANLEDALGQRLRRGMRLCAVLAGPVLIAISSLEIILGIEQPRALAIARFTLGAAALLTGLTLGPSTSHRRVVASALLLQAIGVGYSLVTIAISGGAQSPELATFVLSMAAVTFVIPMDPRHSAPLYIAVYVTVALIGHYASPADTPNTALLNMHKITLLTLLTALLGSWLHHRALREMFEWRLALREESRRAALALERARIARDLHDHVGARLTGIALRAEREQKKLPGEARDALIWIQDTIRLCLEELRDTIWALSNSGRDARELVATLRRRAEDIADAADMHLTWTMNEEVWNGRLSPGVSVALSAILREALTNTIRHSGAKHVSITLAKDSERISVEITDDGKGLGEKPSEGRGLNNMRSRAKEQDGEVRIEPNGTKGVRVIATIPLLSETTQQA